MLFPEKPYPEHGDLPTALHDRIEQVCTFSLWHRPNVDAIETLALFHIFRYQFFQAPDERSLRPIESLQCHVTCFHLTCHSFISCVMRFGVCGVCLEGVQLSSQ